jgi:hypothetical protein
MTTIVQGHLDRHTLRESVSVPDHEERGYSAELERGRRLLKKEGKYKCWICGTEELLELHHLFCEFSLSNVCDFDKLWELSQVFDPYGYGKEFAELPVESSSDVRNMLVLCRLHHRQTYTGIHNISFSSWIMQKLAKDGVTVVVDEDAV